jgi:hypothetical protein
VLLDRVLNKLAQLVGLNGVKLDADRAEILGPRTCRGLERRAASWPYHPVVKFLNSTPGLETRRPRLGMKPFNIAHFETARTSPQPFSMTDPLVTFRRDGGLRLPPHASRSFQLGRASAPTMARGLSRL